MLFTPHQISFGSGNLREGGHLGNPGADERKILKLIFEKWKGGAWIRWIWLGIGTSGGLL